MRFYLSLYLALLGWTSVFAAIWGDLLDLIDLSSRSGIAATIIFALIGMAGGMVYSNREPVHTKKENRSERRDFPG